MPPLPFNYVIRFLRSASGGVGGPIPSLNIDLTSTLDSRITFTRAGARNYINAGVLTAQASSNVPVFESWDGINRGMAIEPAFTNLYTYSNDFSQAAWVKTAGAMTTGDVGPGLITQLYNFNATATANYHTVKRETTSITAGTRQTFSFFVKAAAGATNYSVYLRASNQFDNSGYRAFFRIDGATGLFSIPSEGIFSNAVLGYKKLSSSVYQFWVTGTWATTSNKELMIGVSANANTDARNYTALTTDSFQIFGGQLATANGPTGYVATGAATASQVAEAAIFNDTAWLTTAQGTFIVEHDCWSGPIVGSGANTVVGATVPGKTAFAWDGSTSDTVNNGGATTAGGLPTFSGSDIRLLATTGTTNAGHIKVIKFYNTRLSVAEMQALTAPNVVGTAQPGILRTVSVDNRLPSVINTTAGTLLTFTSRFVMRLGGSACSELRLDFPNIKFAGMSAIGNSISIESVALERETGVSEYAPVYVGGSRSFTVADGAATTVISDAILPGAFTGLTQFDASMTFWVRVKGSVSTAGHVVMGSRAGTESSSFTKLYDPAATTYSAVDGVGTISLVSGSNQATLTQGYCPILVGKFVSGDPKTLFVVGDSIIEGTVTSDTFVKRSSRNLGVPQLEMSQGGRHQGTLEGTLANWSAYLKYSRIFIDEMGTNDGNTLLAYFSYWSTARNTYGYDKIVKLGLFPYVTATSDTYATEAGQTAGRTYPNNGVEGHMDLMLKYGLADYILKPQSVRGTDKSKWLVNGTASYCTYDGLHPTGVGQTLLTTEFQAFLDAITVT